MKYIYIITVSSIVHNSMIDKEVYDFSKTASEYINNLKLAFPSNTSHKSVIIKLLTL